MAYLLRRVDREGDIFDLFRSVTFLNYSIILMATERAAQVLLETQVFHLEEDGNEGLDLRKFCSSDMELKEAVAEQIVRLSTDDKAKYSISAPEELKTDVEKLFESRGITDRKMNNRSNGMESSYFDFVCQQVHSLLLSPHHIKTALQSALILSMDKNDLITILAKSLTTAVSSCNTIDPSDMEQIKEYFTRQSDKWVALAGIPVPVLVEMLHPDFGEREIISVTFPSLSLKFQSGHSQDRVISLTSTTTLNRAWKPRRPLFEIVQSGATWTLSSRAAHLQP